MCGIENINLPNSLRSIGDQAFERTNLKGLTLPEGLQTVGEACFLGNGDMTYLNLSSTMVSGGAKCFAGLTGLATIRCQAVNPPTMGTEAFDKWTSRADIWIPASSADAYRTAPEWCKFNYDAYYEGDTEAVSVHITPSGKITLMDGETRQLHATVMPETTTDKTVVWSSSDPLVATVDADGLVTAHAKLGTAVITGTCGNASGTVSVEVVPTEAHGLSLGVPWPDDTNDYDHDLYVGESWRITAHVEPASLNGSEQWSSSAPNVVSVDQTGLITALSLGVARITASVGTLECGLDFQVTRNNDVSGVGDTGVETVKVSVDGNTITVKGDGSASLWTLDGTVVTGMQSAAGVSFAGLKAGIYILRTGKDSRKIAVY